MKYTIREAAEKAGFEPSVLRYYEKEGLLSGVGRTGNGYRSYTDDDIEKLRLISALRESDMPLAGIRSLMQENAAEDFAAECDRLDSHIRGMREKIARLEEITGELEAYCRNQRRKQKTLHAARQEETAETLEILRRHAEMYPKMRPQDAVKLLYQNEFGGGHIIASAEASFRFLQEEYSRLHRDGSGPEWETIGGGMVRLSLRNLPESWLPAVNRLFVAGAAVHQGDTERFERKLHVLETAAEQGLMPFGTEELNDFLTLYRKNGCPIVSHSPSYREEYGPAYRILPESYAHLLPVAVGIEEILAEKGRAVLSIDGRCGAGKTTLSGIFRQIFDASLVQMDDFFLPVSMRTPERLAEPGGNLDRERFLQEAAPGIASGTAFSYRIFDCSVMDFHGTKAVPAKPLTIIEGSYCQHPELSALADVRLFVTCPPDMQKKRIFLRSGAALYPRFLKEWIPMEERYFETFRIAENCDWILDSSLTDGSFVPVNNEEDLS